MQRLRARWTDWLNRTPEELFRSRSNSDRTGSSAPGPTRLQKAPLWVWGLLIAAALGMFTLASTLNGGGGTLPTPGASAYMPPPLDSLALGFSVLFKLGIVLALIYASLYLLRRWRGGLPGLNTRRMTVLETTRLSPRQTLHLVQVGEQTFLVGATDACVSLLAEVEPEPVSAAAQASEQGTFQERLNLLSVAE